MVLTPVHLARRLLEQRSLSICPGSTSAKADVPRAGLGVVGRNLIDIDPVGVVLSHYIAHHAAHFVLPVRRRWVHHKKRKIVFGVVLVSLAVWP